MRPHDEQDFILEWNARLVFLRSKTFIQITSTVVLLSVLPVGGVSIMSDWPPDLDSILIAAFFMGIGLGIFGIAGVIVLGLLFQGGYDYHYMLDAQGLRCLGSGRSAAINRLIVPRRTLDPHAGTPASTRPSEYVAWDEVDNFSVDAKARIITLKRGWLPRMIVVCNEANYTAVLAFIQQRVSRE